MSLPVTPSVRWGASKRHNRNGDPVAEAFRIARGIHRPETARQKLLRLGEEMVDAIRAHRLHATPERFQRFVAPVLAALAEVDRPRLTKELEIRAEVADEQEDLSEKCYDLNPCPETAVARVRAIDGETARQQQVRAALIAQWALDA